jgi:hypothetical protein
MSTLSPYLNAHPEYLALLGRAESDERTLGTGELGNILVFDGDHMIGGTGEFSLSRIAHQHPRIMNYWKRRKKLRVILRYTKFHGGRSTSADLRIPSPDEVHFPNGRSQIVVNPREAKYPAAARKARDRVGRSVKQRPPRPPPRSSPARPSPEVFVTSFTEVHETNQEPFSGGVGPILLDVIPDQSLYYYREWTGTRTPGFGKLKPSQLPVNPHTVKIKEVGQNRMLNYYGGTVEGKFHLDITRYDKGVFVPTDPMHLPLAQNNAVKKLIDQAGRGIEANLAQDAVQFSQMTQMFAHNVQRIVKSVRNLRRGNIPGAVDALTAGRSRSRMPPGRPSRTKDLAENWLELQYGWKPLLNDIHGAMESMSTMMSSDYAFVQSATASAKAREDSLVRFDYDAVRIGPKRGKLATFTTTTCKYNIRFRVAHPLTSFLAQTGFTNPVNLAWEVLPFSFVVDWFLPIGPYLEAMTAWSGLEFVGGSVTQFTKSWILSTVDYDGINIGNPGGGSFVSDHGACQVCVTMLNRGVLTGFPTLTFPQYKNGLASVTHATNALALLRSVF